MDADGNEKLGAGIDLSVQLAIAKAKGISMLTRIEGADAYMDMFRCAFGVHVEGNMFFRELHREFPDSYFILQTRDENDWIRARFAHRLMDEGENYPTLVERAKEALKIKSDHNLKEYWLTYRRAHEYDVRNYFNDQGRFLEFNIDTDDISKLINFVSDDYTLNARAWKRYNRTEYES